MKSETVYFKIHGEFLTDLARTLWADELEIRKAINLLVTGLVGCPQSAAIDILTGRKKLVGCNDLDLVDDDTTKSKYGNDLSAASVFTRITNEREKTAEETKILVEAFTENTENIPSPWGLCKVPRTMLDRRGSGYGLKYFLKDKYTYDDIKPYAIDLPGAFPARGARAFADSVDNFTGGMPILDQFIEGDKALTKMKEEGAAPDKQLISENGWVAPNGNFFPCGPIMHDSLADILLGKTTDAADAIGRRDGTSIIEQTHVRISKNMASAGRSSILFVGREMTQAQKDTVFDWCKKHGESYPTWINGED